MVLRASKAPNLPIAPVEYHREYFDQFNNLLRLYFNEVDSINTVMATTLIAPNMTTTQRNAIATPSHGQIIYNTTTNKLNVYGASGWEAITSV
jgi:hypothetical protein